MKWMQFLKEIQEVQPTTVIQEDVHSYEQKSSIDVHSDGAVNKKVNRPRSQKHR